MCLVCDGFKVKGEFRAHLIAFKAFRLRVQAQMPNAIVT